QIGTRQIETLTEKRLQVCIFVGDRLDMTLERKVLDPRFLGKGLTERELFCIESLKRHRSVAAAHIDLEIEGILFGARRPELKIQNSVRRFAFLNMNRLHVR